MFERLMNLDVELKCLGTKMFVAKEQFINDVFYSKPRKSMETYEDEEEETEDVQNIIKCQNVLLMKQ